MKRICIENEKVLFEKWNGFNWKRRDLSWKWKICRACLDTKLKRKSDDAYRLHGTFQTSPVSRSLHEIRKTPGHTKSLLSTQRVWSVTPCLNVWLLCRNSTRGWQNYPFSEAWVCPSRTRRPSYRVDCGRGRCGCGRWNVSRGDMARVARGSRGFRGRGVALGLQYVIMFHILILRNFGRLVSVCSKADVCNEYCVI